MSVRDDVIGQLLESLDCTWRWQWVPNAQPGDPVRQAWTEHVVESFAGWTADELEAARRSWPKDADVELPLGFDQVGRAVAESLLEHADQLPAWGRLAWGVAFLNGRARWAPVPVEVRFHDPRGDDPNYLMEVVGAAGREDDARPPVVDYVSTSAGDGVRVSALVSTLEGAVFGRVDAALRLEIPPIGGEPRASIDVLFAAHVFDLGLMTVIGQGVEELMQRVADESMPSADGMAPLRFAPAPVEAQP